MLIRKLLSIVAILVVTAGTLYADTAITLKPLAPPAVGKFGEMAFEITVPWMKGHLRMRMPETVQSRQGFHFIDHFRADMPPVSMLDAVPQWKSRKDSKEIAFSCVTQEGVAFGGRAWPVNERVEMEFFVENRSGEPLERVRLQMCLVMSDAPAFGDKEDITRTYAWVDGAFSSLSNTTPTPAEKNRTAWILMLTRDQAKNYTGAREWTDGWWVVDQLADEEIIARISADRKHLVATTWDDGPMYLMTNTAIPCLHAGPTNAVTLEPGAKHRWRGRIFLTLNNPANLLKQHKKEASK